MKIISRSLQQLQGIDKDFFDIAPFDPEAIKKSLSQLSKQSFPREKLVKILQDYNPDISGIESLRNPETVCVVTGQQLGLMGGPAYTVLKAITCLLLAKETGALPIFWLATEDHDLHEVDHTYLLDSTGNLKEYKLYFEKEGVFVEDLLLLPKHKEVLLSFLDAVKLEEFKKQVVQENSYPRLMVKFLKCLFSGTGLIFLEPHLLRPLAKDFFEKEMAASIEIERVLQNTAQKLRHKGIEPLLSIGETNLFYKDDSGVRKKVRRGSKSLDVLCYSTNVIARPVLQSLLIPTLCYIAGPHELQYHQQLRDYFHFHGCPMPWIAPRLSATMITPEWGNLLNKCHLSPWDLPTSWEEMLPTQRDLRSKIASLGVPYSALHTLNNALNPQKKEQERVLNWCQFHTSIPYMLQELTFSMNSQHHYIYL